MVVELDGSWTGTVIQNTCKISSRFLVRTFISVTLLVLYIGPRADILNMNSIVF